MASCIPASRSPLFSAGQWLLALLVVLLAVPSQAQDRLLSPAEFLGYELGSRFTPHYRVVAYVEHVAAHGANIQVQQYGETNEGRPLLLAFISSAENMARLEEIRTNNLKLTGLEAGDPSGTTPAIVWLSYNVHGNESVSTEAAMATLYDLTNPNNTRTQAWLENTVVILDPCINPDGRDRYVHWYNQMVGYFPNPNPDAREHMEPWPGGRTNHYYFDLNRDWSWATQRETQQRLPIYNQWMPHVHVDFHEQGVNQPYFFAPAAEPFHERITPWQRELQTIIGLNHAGYFDQNNWLYFTRQVFDLFYPGYGDTWPTFNGAIGMTYEQGGSSRAGLGIITAEGDTLTLGDRIAHHHTTGLSTVETAANNHTRIITEFQNYFENAQTNPGGDYKTYVVKGSNAKDKLRALTTHLDHQGITYGYATESRRANGFDYADRSTAARQISEGDLIISPYQPKGVLTSVLFDPESTLSDSLTYDITAWALPYIYGLEAYALTDRLNPDADSHQAPTTAPADIERPLAYLAEWKSFEDLRFLAAVLNEDIKLRFAERPFEMNGQRFDRGTLILTRTGNEAMGDRFDQIIREAAEELGQPLFPVSTGYVTKGADFGSSQVPYLKKPRVAVLAGNRVSSYALGEIWHFFDQQLGYPVTLLEATSLGGSVNLYNYDVLILPSGSYGSVLTDARLTELKSWIQAGGRLVAMERGATFLAGKEGFSLKRKKSEDDEKKDDKDNPSKKLRTYATDEREDISDAVPGAIFRVQLDATHPLGFGYDTTYFTLKRGDDAYDFLENAWNVGVLREDARLSGFAGAKSQKKLKDTLVFGVQDMGRGEVVYLLDDLLFRGFWYNGRLLLGNAIFLVGQRSGTSF